MSRRTQVKLYQTNRVVMSGMVMGVWLASASTALASYPMRPVVPSTNTAQDLIAQPYQPPPPNAPPNDSSSSGVVRGETHRGLCFISPIGSEAVILSDRPLFYWIVTGKKAEIQIQRISLLDESGEVLWETGLAVEAQSIAYRGAALQPGQQYVWRLEWQELTTVDGQTPSWSSLEQSYTFQVMDANQRSGIVAELQRLSNGVNSETAANHQADYLIEQQLTSDALQVLSTVENPSAATVQRIQELVKSACSG